MNLFELQRKYLDFIHAIHETGEIPDELETLETDIGNKLDAYEYIASMLAGNIVTLKERENDITKEIAKLNRNIDKLKARIKETVEMTESRKIKTDLYEFSLRKTKSSLVVDETALPFKYFSEVISQVVNKKMIEDDLKNNLPVEGVLTKENFALHKKLITKNI